MNSLLETIKNRSKDVVRRYFPHVLLAAVTLHNASHIAAHLVYEKICDYVILRRNEQMPADQKTAVFYRCHIPDSINSFVEPRMQVLITSYQNELGRKVDWYSNSTNETILETITNEEYQNILLVGNDFSDLFAEKGQN